MATVLSVESQATSVGIAIVSPLLGLAVDATPEYYRFAPIALFGLTIATTAFVLAPIGRVSASPGLEPQQAHAEHGFGEELKT